MKRQWIDLPQPFPVETNKGFGYAWFILDMGFEHNIQWFVCLNQGPNTGQFWVFDNSNVRACKNETMGRDYSDRLEKK